MSTYTAKTGDVIAPGLSGGGSQGAVTELTTRIRGVIAACGEAALAVVLGWTQGKLYTSNDVAQIVKDAIPHGASPTGTSTPSELAATAQGYGVQLQSLDWTAALRNFAGQVPILLGISNATALGGSDVGVKGHFITVVGKTSGGNYIVSDPNTKESTQGKYVQYSPQQIANAQPFSAQIVRGGQSAMAQQNPSIDIPGLQGVQDALTNLTNTFSGIGSFATDWLANPWRIVKLVTGLGLIGLTLWATVNINAAKAAIQVAEGVTGAAGIPGKFTRAGAAARGLGAKPPQVLQSAPKTAPTSTTAPTPTPTVSQPVPRYRSAPARTGTPTQPISRANTQANVDLINKLGKQIGKSKKFGNHPQG